MYIYIIINTANGKIYIGKHSGDDLNKYLRRNITDALRGYRGKTYLYRAIREHGFEKFVILSLLSVQGITCQQLNECEKYYIKMFKSQDPSIGYNLTPGGDGFCEGHNFSKGKNCSQETKDNACRRMKAMWQNHEYRTNQSNAHKDKGWSEMRRVNQPKQKGGDMWIYGKHHTSDVRKKISSAVLNSYNDPKRHDKMIQNNRNRAHIRWHVKRGLLNNDCDLCNHIPKEQI